MKNRLKEVFYAGLDLINMSKGLKRKINNWEIVFPVRYYKYFPSNYEVENFVFLEESCKEGATILDIGAHIGLYSVIMAKIAGNKGKVFSFEPTPVTREILEKTLKLNKVTSTVTICSQAISDKVAKSAFYISNDNLADNGNTLVNYRNDRQIKAIEVDLTTLDIFKSQHSIKVDFLKIDTEGAELDVLKGAQKTFLEDKPKAILSLHPVPIKERGDSMEAIYDRLISYKLKIIFEGREMSREEFCNRKELFDVHLYPL